jgi:pimeloyl-ACP methyl ester carboxylesterase
MSEEAMMQIQILLAAVSIVSAPMAVASPANPASDRFRVVVEGSGPDVILIPGLSSSAAVWNNTAKQLKPNHRVHRIQVAGFAGEPTGSNAEGLVVSELAADLAEYIKSKKMKAPAIIGHSLGGETALMIAARHPCLVGSVMTVDSLPFYSLLFNPAATASSVRPQADAIRDRLLSQSDEEATAAAGPALGRLIKSELARPDAILWSINSNRGVVARAMHELMTTDLRPELENIRAPITVVYAYDSSYGVPYSRIDNIFKTAYVNARHINFERIDESYHFVMFDQPEKFAAAVDRFLASGRAVARVPAKQSTRAIASIPGGSLPTCSH